jgi:CheY-like chemotaxis protein
MTTVEPKPPEAGSLDLNGVRILLVEDSWYLGIALQSLLQECGADVAGPVATTAEAERLISEQVPDVALVDLNLRGGERADGLIDRLHDQGIRVVVISGDTVLPLAPGNAAAILPKPFSETQLFATLLPTTGLAADRRGSWSPPSADRTPLLHNLAVALTDDELAIVQRAAGPLPRACRDAFERAVVAERIKPGKRPAGDAYRVALAKPRPGWENNNATPLATLQG